MTDENKRCQRLFGIYEDGDLVMSGADGFTERLMKELTEFENKKAEAPSAAPRPNRTRTIWLDPVLVASQFAEWTWTACPAGELLSAHG